jgi:heptosyltransferase-2
VSIQPGLRQLEVTSRPAARAHPADGLAPSPRRDGARRILLATKYRFLGDAVCLTPALRAARQAWPVARIALLTGTPVRALLQGCPHVDEFILFAPLWREWEPWSNLRLIHRLWRRGFDQAILFNRAFHPALVTTAAGIPCRIGLDTDYRGRLLTTRVPPDATRHEIGCNLDLLAAAGVPREAEQPFPELWLTNAERQAALANLAARGIGSDRPLVGMQPGSRRADRAEEREWGSARFARVGDLLTHATGARLIVMGSAEERAASERVAALMRHGPVVLTGETGLREALAVVSLCRLWIGNDSGLRHVAVALGVPTVGILNPTNAARWGYQTPCHRTLVAHPPTPRRDPGTLRRCLDAVSPEAVFEAAMAVWTGTTIRRPDPP